MTSMSAELASYFESCRHAGERSFLCLPSALNFLKPQFCSDRRQRDRQTVLEMALKPGSRCPSAGLRRFSAWRTATLGLVARHSSVSPVLSLDCVATPFAVEVPPSVVAMLHFFSCFWIRNGYTSRLSIVVGRCWLHCYCGL